MLLCNVLSGDPVPTSPSGVAKIETRTVLANPTCQICKISASVHWAPSKGVYPRTLVDEIMSLIWMSSKLPPPIRPSAARRSSSDDGSYGRGSLSDYSDYQSSDEETHNRASTSRGRGYSGSDTEEGYHKKPLSRTLPRKL